MVAVEVSPEVNILLKVCKQKDESLARAEELAIARNEEISRLQWEIHLLEEKVDKSQLEKYQALEQEYRKQTGQLMDMRNRNNHLIHETKRWRYNIAEMLTEGYVLLLLVFVFGILLSWLLW